VLHSAVVFRSSSISGALATLQRAYWHLSVKGQILAKAPKLLQHEY
jgi:hypothetical protein